MDKLKDRRRVLRIVGMGLTLGFAGCTGGDNSGSKDSTESTPTQIEKKAGNGTATMTDSTTSQGCETPSGPASYESLKPVLPGGDGYNQGNPQGITAQERLPLQGAIRIGYEGQNGNFKLYVGKYDSRSAAQNDGETQAAQQLDEQYDLVEAGYLVIENWLFAASGNSKESVTDFLATSNIIDQGCLSDKFIFIDTR